MSSDHCSIVRDCSIYDLGGQTLLHTYVVWAMVSKISFIIIPTYFSFWELPWHTLSDHTRVLKHSLSSLQEWPGKPRPTDMSCHRVWSLASPMLLKLLPAHLKLKYFGTFVHLVRRKHAIHQSVELICVCLQACLQCYHSWILSICWLRLQQWQ